MSHDDQDIASALRLLAEKGVTIDPEKVKREQLARIFCQVFDHARVRDHHFGYVICTRCQDRIGDNLAGPLMWDTDNVYMGHKQCAKCQRNYAALSEAEKLLCPDPFGPEVEEDDEQCDE